MTICANINIDADLTYVSVNLSRRKVIGCLSKSSGISLDLLVCLYERFLICLSGLMIHFSKANRYSAMDVSLTFLSFHYPRKLIKHLKGERKLTVAKVYPGVYHINKETFDTQIIVTKELPPKDNIYLHFLTDRVWNGTLAECLADDYKEHQDEELYRRYMHQITLAGNNTKGDAPMYICEGLLNLCGTSSEEIIERTKKEDAEYYQPRIDSLSSQNDYLKSLLIQHNIPFDLEAVNNAE